MINDVTVVWIKTHSRLYEQLSLSECDSELNTSNGFERSFMRERLTAKLRDSRVCGGIKEL